MSLETELQDALDEFSKKLKGALEVRMKKKKLLKTGELQRSLGNITWDLGVDNLMIEVNIAQHGRYNDMKLRRGEKNRKKWGYSRTLWASLRELQDRLTIIVANHVREEVLDGFRLKL